MGTITHVDTRTNVPPRNVRFPLSSRLSRGILKSGILKKKPRGYSRLRLWLRLHRSEESGSARPARQRDKPHEVGRRKPQGTLSGVLRLSQMFFRLEYGWSSRGLPARFRHTGNQPVQSVFAESNTGKLETTEEAVAAAASAAAVRAAHRARVTRQLLKTYVVAFCLQFSTQLGVLLDRRALLLFFFNPALFSHKEDGEFTGIAQLCNLFFQYSRTSRYSAICRSIPARRPKGFRASSAAVVRRWASRRDFSSPRTLG